MVRVIGFDHIVLRVRDREASLRFYGDVLGMEKLRVDEWRAGKAPFPSVRAAGHTIIDLIPKEGDAPSDSAHRNLDHFCMVIDRGDFEQIERELAATGVTVEGELAERWGARGWGTSIYIRDPDGNRIEIKHYQ